jgi:hypothetical protein
LGNGLAHAVVNKVARGAWWCFLVFL